jgi:hypothetical protein
MLILSLSIATYHLAGRLLEFMEQKVRCFEFQQEPLNFYLLFWDE